MSKSSSARLGRGLASGCFPKTRGIKGYLLAVYLSLGHELTAAQRLKVSATTLLREPSLGAVLGPGSLKKDVTSGDGARYCGGLLVLGCFNLVS